MAGIGTREVLAMRAPLKEKVSHGHKQGSNTYPADIRAPNVRGCPDAAASTVEEGDLAVKGACERGIDCEAFGDMNVPEDDRSVR